MLPNIIVRKATRRDSQQLMWQKSPELVCPFFFNLFVPLGLIWFIWLHSQLDTPLKWIFLTLFSLWAFIFAIIFLYALGQILGLVLPHSKNSDVWVAVYGGKAIAEVTVDCHTICSHLHQLSVRKRFRRQGVGSFLVNQVSHQVVKPVYVQTESYLRDFYLRSGFTRVSDQELPDEIRKIFQLIQKKHPKQDIQSYALLDS